MIRSSHYENFLSIKFSEVIGVYVYDQAFNICEFLPSYIHLGRWILKKSHVDIKYTF